MNKSANLIAFALAVAAGAGHLRADAIYATSVVSELTGSRNMSSGGGVNLLAGGDLTEFSMSWTITGNAAEYHYAYEISGSTGPGLGFSHFALELSDTCTVSSACITNAIVNGVDVQSALDFGKNSSSNGDPGLPTNFYGVRFEPWSATQLPVSISFDSDRAPVYGDFYLKAGRVAEGNGGAAWNTGNTLGNISSTTIDFVPRPDSFRVQSIAASEVPEPESYVLLGSSLVLFGILQRRLRKR